MRCPYPFLEASTLRPWPVSFAVPGSLVSSSVGKLLVLHSGSSGGAPQCGLHTQSSTSEAFTGRRPWPVFQPASRQPANAIYQRLITTEWFTIKSSRSSSQWAVIFKTGLLGVFISGKPHFVATNYSQKNCAVKSDCNYLEVSWAVRVTIGQGICMYRVPGYMYRGYLVLRFPYLRHQLQSMLPWLYHSIQHDTIQ